MWVCLGTHSRGSRAVLDTAAPRCPHHAPASLACDARRTHILPHPDGDSIFLYSNTLKDCGVTAKARRRRTPLCGTQLGSTPHRTQQDVGCGADALRLAEHLLSSVRTVVGLIMDCRVESIIVIIVQLRHPIIYVHHRTTTDTISIHLPEPHETFLPSPSLAILTRHGLLPTVPASRT
ncbi:hypothetical protein B0H12DRAFT_611244 [Mycena haematopus]|nr:hypothetical protein B0H12DRAFT_611244 [Mycena haematopus]